MDRIETAGVIGTDVPRVDGVAKVTGSARYGADHRVDGAAWAYLKGSDIAKGRVRDIDQTAARAVPGVLEILTHRNVGSAVRPDKPLVEGGHMASSVAPLYSDKIYHAEQIVAVVVAETFEAARAAAAVLAVTYDAEEPSATLDSPGATEAKAHAMGETNISVGHFEKAFAAAAVTVDRQYETPPQHHNPMELFQTTAAWDGDHLTVWESSQSVTAYQHGLAKQLDLSPKQVRVLSKFVGGAFGSRGEMAQSTALVALAARRLGRPVKLVVTRRQGFSLRTFRAETRHHVRLAADRDGRLQALSHRGWELTSRTDRFALAGIEATCRLYACPNIDAKTVNVEADRQTPGFMRAPPEVPYMFALESAMDELACELGIDPVELRKRNETQHEPVNGRPFTSRSLVQCFDAASAAFGWASRDPRVGSMRDGDWLVGYGCATAMYPAQIAPATCRVTLAADGRATVETGSHDIGTGLYTILTQLAADQLGVPMSQVTVLLGDTDLPAAPLTAGSSTTASIGTVVAKACQEIRGTLAGAAVKATGGQLHGLDAGDLKLSGGRLVAPTGAAEPLTQAVHRVHGGGPVVADVSNNPAGAPPVIGPMLIRRGLGLIVSGSKPHDAVRYAFGAQFAEVRVHRDTGEVRAARLVGAFAAGRIMNPRTARSQLSGGQVWGMSSALLEATEIDRRSARYANPDLAEYHVAVAADVPSLTTIMVSEEDHLVNPLGVKGVGELGVVGLNAAVANAVFHATGVRVRKLPIRVGAELLAGLSRG